MFQSFQVALQCSYTLDFRFTPCMEQLCGASGCDGSLVAVCLSLESLSPFEAESYADGSYVACTTGRIGKGLSYFKLAKGCQHWFVDCFFHTLFAYVNVYL